jgi:hypothetical protein
VGGGRYETCLAGVSEARSPPSLALPHKAAIFWGGFIFNIVDMIVGPTAWRNRVDACEPRAVRLWNAPHPPW